MDLCERELKDCSFNQPACGAGRARASLRRTFWSAVPRRSASSSTVMPFDFLIATICRMVLATKTLGFSAATQERGTPLPIGR
jgi:hypothetical protein